MIRTILAACWTLAGLAVAAPTTGAPPAERADAGPAIETGRSETAPADSAPADETDTQPVEPQPAEAPAVTWLDSFDAAGAAARQRDVPIVLVFLDPDAPASIMLVERVLPDPRVVTFLAGTAAVKLNATVGAGRKLFESTGAKEAPLTQTFAPDGELLDVVAGAIVPAEAYRDRLARTMDYWRASRVKPFDAAARFKAVQARLKLSTRAKAGADIEALLKLPADKLPEGVTPARLHVAAGLAAEKPEKAAEAFRKAMALGPKDPQAAGRAILELGRQAMAEKKYRDARDLFRQYVADFAAGPDIGRAYYDLAMADYAVDGPAQAVKTLEEFIGKYPEDPTAVMARKLLDGMKMLDRKDAKK